MRTLFIVFLFHPSKSFTLCWLKNTFWWMFKKIKKKGWGRSPRSVTNLCPVVLWPLRDAWLYACLPGLSSSPPYCTSSSSFRVVLQENVRHRPLNMCLNDISPACLWSAAVFQEMSEYLFSTDRLLRWSDWRCRNVVFLKTNHDGRRYSPSHSVAMTFCALILWS